MSNEESKTINVKVEGSKREKELEEEIRSLTEILDEKDSLLNEIAQKEFEDKIDDLASKYPDYASRIRNVETPSQYEFIKGFLEGEPTHKKSTGSVRLRTHEPDNPLLREFESPADAIRELYKHALDSKSPYYNQANKIREHLVSIFKREDMPRIMELPTNPIENLAREELGNKYDYMTYTKWIQKKAKERTQIA